MSSLVTFLQLYPAGLVFCDSVLGPQILWTRTFQVAELQEPSSSGSGGFCSSVGRAQPSW